MNMGFVASVIIGSLISVKVLKIPQLCSLAGGYGCLSVLLRGRGRCGFPVRQPDAYGVSAREGVHGVLPPGSVGAADGTHEGTRARFRPQYAQVFDEAEPCTAGEFVEGLFGAPQYGEEECRVAARHGCLFRGDEACCDSTEVHEDLLKIVNDTMPEETELYDLAELFKVFGDSTRIRILFVLFEAEVCVCDLAQVLNMTQSAISHQLRILKQNKLVKNRREGKSIFYSLADDHVRAIIAQGREHIEE